MWYNRYCKEVNFNPLPPCGGRRSPLVSTVCRSTISIHSLRVEGDSLYIVITSLRAISIHSLRVEGDVLLYRSDLLSGISIHSLRVEGNYS